MEADLAYALVSADKVTFKLLPEAQSIVLKI
jgi:hypothetical protein